MSHWQWEQRESGTAVLRIDGEATVETVDRLHAVLREGIETYEQLEIDFAPTTGVDFYTIQLLCSAHRTALARNKGFAFHAPPAPVVTETIRMMGFVRNEGCRLCTDNVRCLWI